MPITLADINTEYTINRIGGNAQTKKHLMDLGFNVGEPVKVISVNNQSVIVNIKGARIALGEDLARRVFCLG